MSVSSRVVNTIGRLRTRPLGIWLRWRHISGRTTAVNASAPLDKSQDPAWRYRWLLLTSGIAVLIAFGALARIADSWRWPLFFWGLPIGLVACAPVSVAIVVRLRSGELSPERRSALRFRLVLYAIQGLYIGAVVGSLAAVTDAAWIDKLFAVLAVVFPLTGLALVLLVYRSRRRQRP